MNTVLEKKYLHESVVKLVLEAPEIARKRLPGQFIVLMIGDRGERIPLTIVESDTERGTISIISQTVGKTTADLAELEAGDSIKHVLGPLGRPTEIENFGTSVCIGGGVGVGVVYPIATALKEKGNRVISIIGARTKDLLILEEEMSRASDELIAATDDGSYGYHGFVSGVLQELIDKGTTIDRVFAIGPVPMMRVICNVTKPYGIKTIVSLNPIMVDATGMCGACRVSVAGKTQFGCVDGPEFDGHDVDFDLLMNRLRMYSDQERQAMECRCAHDGK
ncbi:MAG: sulfide/dihydroorotate dehydrogenase-like FAD/NAD-binding protein [Syntrophales bacterium]|nr:sulfide/dihydroorotate dehydrogenase-like FAD/NAD-binding protein [Syntrophales bacterium]MCK9527548.1 sulfide/dihydroorotate dehydrogenase-like FAD/NAD-binding protein [Syntrophales bacterium]MDX9922605.1 sulfide/dihydroorotate dehydrogenase-like FAD/NAD-binding protein [Syntrophales bacterium]